MTWTDEITPEQWEEWMKLARKLSGAKKQATSLGYEDYAAQAIEKLIQQPARPNNIQGWLSLTINRQYIDRFRKIQARGGASNRDLSDEQWEEEMALYAVGGPSAFIQKQESVAEVLAVLTDKEREILIMAAAGFDNNEIAMHLGYRTNKIVATRIKQIEEKARKALTQSSS
jgi:DNA-directed RNA polymerase specialized sigma24 family protein